MGFFHVPVPIFLFMSEWLDENLFSTQIAPELRGNETGSVTSNAFYKNGTTGMA